MSSKTEPNKLNRYLVFCGQLYYPCGGWDDFVSSHKSLEEAEIKRQAIHDKISDWSHIVDISDGHTFIDQEEDQPAMLYRKDIAYVYDPLSESARMHEDYRIAEEAYKEFAAKIELRKGDGNNAQPCSPADSENKEIECQAAKTIQRLIAEHKAEKEELIDQIVCLNNECFALQSED